MAVSDSSDEEWAEEEAGFGQETHRLLQEQSSDDAPDEVDAFSKSTGRLRLRPDISLDENEYSGRKSRRKEAFDESSDEEDFRDRAELQPSFSDEDDEGDDDDEEKAEKNDVDEDFDAVNKEYEDLQREEEEMLKALRGHNDVDVRKGRAVRNQKELWDNALHMRIALQKIVTEPHQDDANESSSQETLKTEAFQTLDALLDLENALLEQNREALESQGKDTLAGGDSFNVSTSLESAWQRLTHSYTRLIPYRDRTVDRWQRKTQISSGAAASRSKLKAFNQSISQQVAAAIKDRPRLISRMMRPDTSKSEKSQIDGEANAHTSLVFDDSEFYQQLLREFLESSDPGALDQDALRKLRSKKRKNVDRRASKGRKIRYTVHEPLVNFMVPEPMIETPMATKLFSSLFGSKPATSAMDLEAAA